MPKVNRRTLLVGGVAVAGAGLALARSADESGPRTPYFKEMQSALKDAGIAQPTLVIDKARLNENIDLLVSDLPADMGYRIVSKSLPSVDLLRHIRTRSGSDRLMTFNQPMLSTLSKEMPDANQLLGKPLPAQAAHNYFSSLTVEDKAALQNVQWLVDTPQRLNEYKAIADAQGTVLPINIELDVGLHRGGVKPGDDLATMLTTIHEAPSLSFAGFMGYEPHLAKVPSILGWQTRARETALGIYTQALAAAAAIFGETEINTVTRNAAGSPTYRMYKNTDVANEISAGSALVKPTDFDTELLQGFQPAAFIATPVIKALDTTETAVLEFADGMRNFMDRNLDQTIFIHGGHWLAKPEDPPGLRLNKTFGRSSNQEMLNGGAALDIKADDFVFLRPTQSEAVFLQFGDIAVYEDGKITGFWPVFPASA
ncbi:MAG: alanine racemase [Parvibaculaceae bacterium]|nr:alanine racemase [Parvibaculaceae bacterium]